ncbi:MAG: hypothetical protein ACTTIV_02100 [Campylobacter sp.]
MSDENIIKQPTISQTFTIQQLEKMAEMLLRTKYANKIYWLLVGEIAFICIIATIDGFNLFGFKLNEYLLGSLIYGFLTHTFFLVKIIVKNLFTR